MIGTDGHQSGKFAVCAGEWVKGEFSHSADFAERALQMPVKCEVPLRVVARSGVHVGKPWVGGHLLVDFRVIFHGARPERVETRVDAKVVGRHIVVVAHHGQFVGFGEVERSLAQAVGGDFRRRSRSLAGRDAALG